MDFVYPLARQAFNYYLGSRGRGRRRGGRRRGGRKRGGMGRSGARVVSRVPTRSLMQGSFSGSIRNYFTIPPDTTYYKSFKIGDLLADSFAGLGSQFGEYRINSMRVYYEPNAATSTAGSYAGALVDTSHVNAKALSYGQVLALPGSTSRKAYQSSGYHWKWTEPSDAEFFSVKDGGNTICDFYLASNSDAKLIGGDLIVDVSMILRSCTYQVGDSILLRCLRLGKWDLDTLYAVREELDSRIDLEHQRRDAEVAWTNTSLPSLEDLHM